MYYLEKIKKHLSNWFDYAKEHLIRIFFMLLLFIIFCYILTLFPKIFEDGEQHILILGITLSNWSIWLGILGIVCAAIWAIYEYDKSRISTQQEKSSEIAKIFSDDLLDKCSILIAVFQNSPLKPLLDQIDPLNPPFEHFTTEELREISNNDDFPNFYKTDSKSINFDYIYFRVLEQRITVKSEYKQKYARKNEQEKNSTENKKDEKSNISQHNYSTQEARELFILDNKTFPFHFSSLIDEVLNSLESVCMNISSHAAGSVFIYQSLHQIFFDTVNVLGFEISTRNNGKYSDKFFTNIIYVYNEWQKLYKKSIKDEVNKKDQNKKMLNPKIKTVE